MTTMTRETILLKTPQGHDVLAELDYAAFNVRRAKVVHCFTGVIQPLGAGALDDLARALRAQQIYEHALRETQSIEETLAGFGTAMAMLGSGHPAIAPYHREAEQHRAIASQMSERAQHFRDTAMRAIDHLAGD